MQHRALKAVLFDLDGTLLDTAPDFASVLNAMLRRHGRAPLPYQHVRQTVSDGARALIKLGFDIEPPHADFADLLQELLSNYRSQLSEKTTLFQGVTELLTQIEEQNLLWGIVTNKPQLYTDAILRDLNLDHRSGATICPDHVTHKKPHPESIHLACSYLNCEAREVIYVGDHRRDIEAGINAGSLTIAAGWGYISPNDPPEHWGADTIASKAEEILTFIRQTAGHSS